MIPTIDPTIVNELRDLSDDEEPEFFFNQVRLFADRGRTLVNELRSAVSADDPDRVSSAAHALGGSAAIVGASKLHGLCMGLEEHCEHWRRPHAQVTIDLIGEEFERAERHLLGEVSAVCIEVLRPS